MIVDAETFAMLDPSETRNETTAIPPQYYELKWEELAEAATIILAVGGSVAILQILLYLVFEKALNSSRHLIFALQFLDFIKKWQIKLPDRLKLYLNELKRISLGEYLDDVELNKKVAEWFGFDV